ncbi:MAG TPA: HAMP domain-containing protein, partial [Deltaproteobacteria bacterium]|nr:HAMP domain-containing protein [Deltaproteobacteria bacterium]
MCKTLRIKILCLFLVVSLLSLGAAVALRFMFIADFEQYREGELLDRVQWLTASIEATYEHAGEWHKKAVAHDVIRALMLGLDITVRNSDNRIVMTSTRAMEQLSSATQEKVRGALASQRLGSPGKTMGFPLFVQGTEIGSVDVTFMQREKDLAFIKRADALLAFSLAFTGVVVILASFGLARGITAPVNRLAEAARSIEKGETGRKVPVSGSDEIAVLSNTFNRMSDALRRQESLRKKLISDVAHELRTPVAAVRAELEAMIDGVIPAEKETLESLLEETGRLTSLIEGIEDMAHAEADALSLKPESLDLRSFLHDVAERFGPLFTKADVRLSVECPPETSITADPEKLNRILDNILGNSLNASEAGGRVILRGS